MSWQEIVFIIQQTQNIAIPLLIVALGGFYSERSGVVNIALEGIMVFGSFFGIVTVFLIQQSGTVMNPFLLYGLGCLAAIVSGILIAAIHAFASINMNADQTISGTAINMFAPAFTIFFARQLYSVKDIPYKNVFMIKKVPLLGDIPILGELLFQRAYLTTLIGLIILLVTIFIVYKTKFGLHLRAAGENPHALDSAGVSVAKVRWISVLTSGALAALGGFTIMIPISISFSGTANGYGFLAIAILIFAQWKPLNILFTSLFFALLLTIANTFSGIPFLLALKIPDSIFKMVPYLATLLVLFFTSKRSLAPKSLGEPYDKGKR